MAKNTARRMLSVTAADAADGMRPDKGWAFSFEIKQPTTSTGRPADWVNPHTGPNYFPNMVNFVSGTSLRVLLVHVPWRQSYVLPALVLLQKRSIHRCQLCVVRS